MAEAKLYRQIAERSIHIHTHKKRKRKKNIYVYIYNLKRTKATKSVNKSTSDNKL